MKFNKIIYSLLFLLIWKINVVSAQKLNIDSNAYSTWSSLESAKINSNGKYVSYSIEKGSLGGKTFIVQSTGGKWKKTFTDASSSHFLSTKGKDYVLFINRKDSLFIVSLGSDLIQSIANVNSFNVCQDVESEWISYQLKQPQKKLILQNLHTGRTYAYNDVIGKILGNDGQTVLLQTQKKFKDRLFQELSWVNLVKGEKTSIWEGRQAEGIILDTKHHQIAFASENCLFSYNLSLSRLKCLINKQETSLDSGLKIGEIKSFSNDGNRLLIELVEKGKQKPKLGNVEIWNYLDPKIQTQQETEIGTRNYFAVVNLIDGKIIRLEQEFENLSINSFDKPSDTLGLITRDARDNGDWYNRNKYSYYLVSLKNGKRISLKYPPLGLSPLGKYLVYFDEEQRTYISYDTKTGSHNSISKAFSETHTEQNFERHGIAGWLQNDKGVLYYDNFDIWQLDLSGKNAPINLTAGYGKKHNLALAIIDGLDTSFPITKKQKILIAFDLKSKQNGFYSLELDRVNKPKLLSMGNYIYFVPSGVQVQYGYGGTPPIKSKKEDVYLVRRMSATEAPNIFYTRDFKIFTSLSDLTPERKYNWYTTELHTWTSLDGKNLQGVLYKPENFDPTKKYPVIFLYYEDKSNNVNAYIKPENLCNGCVIDIPSYVSNGYLVFAPDIVYKMGDPMQGTYDAVVSAAKHVSALPYVNSTKMGIQGCSWGGFQTNYLVTHTNLFAAACSASGVADWISHSGRLFPNGYAIRGMYEIGQFRMGSSFWEIPDAYVKNSPIFQLDKVTTPFLIMHTMKDAVCPYEDAIELFTGLRRLGKKSWMLAYPDENHGIFDKKKASDFSTRMMQFFDHYLKDKPAPIWMTRGIPASMRGLDDGLAYDIKIKTPGPGLLTIKEQRKVDSMMTRKPILIELK